MFFEKVSRCAPGRLAQPKTDQRSQAPQPFQCSPFPAPIPAPLPRFDSPTFQRTGARFQAAGVPPRSGIQTPPSSGASFQGLGATPQPAEDTPCRLGETPNDWVVTPAAAVVTPERWGDTPRRAPVSFQRSVSAVQRWVSTPRSAGETPRGWVDAPTTPKHQQNPLFRVFGPPLSAQHSTLYTQPYHLWQIHGSPGGATQPSDLIAAGVTEVRVCRCACMDYYPGFTRNWICR